MIETNVTSGIEHAAMKPISRDSLTRSVYETLRTGVMEGRFRPGHRFKIRDLAASMQVSETPIREALMQLVRARALELLDGRSIIVAHMTHCQYVELRNIRLYLEGVAGETATQKICADDICFMQAAHEELVVAEEAGHWADAVRANWQFHHRLYEAAEMPELLHILDDIWMRNGPLLNFLYPHARPTYDGAHQHLAILENLKKRDGEGVKIAIQEDMRQGGAKLLRLLESVGGTRNIGPEQDNLSPVSTSRG